MDTGLNNKNTLHIALDNPFMEDVEWIVEATSEERHHIWGDYHEKHNWEEVSSGQLYTILQLKVKANVKGKKVKETLPISLDCSYAIIDGHKIMFYTSPSRLTHSGYIEAFLTTYFQRTHDNYTRWNHVDAANFHNCAGYLDTVDEKPRTTVYKPEDYEKKYFVFEPV